MEEAVNITRQELLVWFVPRLQVQRRKRCDSVGGGVSHCYVRMAVIGSLRSAAFARVANANPSLSSPFVSHLTFLRHRIRIPRQWQVAISPWHVCTYTYVPPRNRTVKRPMSLFSLAARNTSSLRAITDDTQLKKWILFRRIHSLKNRCPLWNAIDRRKTTLILKPCSVLLYTLLHLD